MKSAMMGVSDEQLLARRRNDDGGILIRQGPDPQAFSLGPAFNSLKQRGKIRIGLLSVGPSFEGAGHRTFHNLQGIFDRS